MYKKEKERICNILTEEQILFIIEMRNKGTFRYVAERFAEKFPDVGISPGNQIDGMLLVDAVVELNRYIDK